MLSDSLPLSSENKASSDPSPKRIAIAEVNHDRHSDVPSVVLLVRRGPFGIAMGKTEPSSGSSPVLLSLGVEPSKFMTLLTFDLFEGKPSPLLKRVSTPPSS